MSKFITKIVYHDNGTCDLLLPNGECVAHGTGAHCWDERDKWEEKLRQQHVQLELF